MSTLTAKNALLLRSASGLVTGVDALADAQGDIFEGLMPNRQAGDLMFALVKLFGSGMNIAGWTKLIDNGENSWYLFKRVATNDSNDAINASGLGGTYVLVLRTTLTTTTVGGLDASTGTSVTVPSGTAPAPATDLILAFQNPGNQSELGSFNTPSGFTALANSTDEQLLGAQLSSRGAAFVRSVGAGATGTTTLSRSGSTFEEARFLGARVLLSP